MIKYNLKCNNNHEFESWFSESKEFERLKTKKLLECIYCNSKIIDKSIMAPMISVSKNDSINNHNSCCDNSRNNFLLNVPDAHRDMEISNYDTNFIDVLTDEMIFIEGGEFMMGSIEESFALQNQQINLK